MTVKTKKLFISYRSSDHREVDYIAEQLCSLKHNEGVAKFKIWQDKYDLKGGKSWWDGIIDAIIDCEMFVFHLSPDYLASKVCMAELDYAIERGRPIIPIVLDMAYFINPRTKKPEIDFWDSVPDWLSKYQFIFYNEDDFLKRFEGAVAEYERIVSRDIPARRPLNPDAESLHGTNYEVYATAVDYAQKVAFEDAKPLFRELLQRNDQDFAEICHQWLTLIDRYQDLLDAKKHRAPRAIFQRKWRNYIALFPLDFVDELYPNADEESVIFDPNHLSKQRRQVKKKVPLISPQRTSRPEKPVVQVYSPSEERTVGRGDLGVKAKPTSLSLMPPPFEWIEIPNKGLSKGYRIAKYPVTNAQFTKFIEAGGYNTEHWWTKQGWQQKQEEPRTLDNSKWNGAELPLKSVSWFEAVAFCLWLSETTGEKIMLPTENQSRYAAQGDDRRTYPWGNIWNRDLCNNNVDKKGIGKATPVTHYEGKGDSPFGVVDMAGNVWEWCLTDYSEKTNDINSSANTRVLRGGSWELSSANNFRCDYRDGKHPSHGLIGYGFRLARYNY